MHHRTLICLALAAGCSPSSPPSNENAPNSAVSDSAVTPYNAVALRAAWRESVQFRSAKVALANNKASLATDLRKADRMLEVTEAYKRLPLVSDIEADAKHIETLLRDALKALSAKGSVVVVRENRVPPPSGDVSTEAGLRYTDAQIAPSHRVVVKLDKPLVDGPRFVRRLKQLERLFLVTEVSLKKGAATLSGRVHFFHDFKPVRFVPPKADSDAIIAKAAGVAPSLLDAKGKAVGEKIRANYQQVEAVRAEMRGALENEAQLAIVQRRFQFFSAHVDAFNGITWTSLLKGNKGKVGGDHGHPR